MYGADDILSASLSSPTPYLVLPRTLPPLSLNQKKPMKLGRSLGNPDMGEKKVESREEMQKHSTASIRWWSPTQLLTNPKVVCLCVCGMGTRFFNLV